MEPPGALGPGPGVDAPRPRPRPGPDRRRDRPAGAVVASSVRRTHGVQPDQRVPVGHDPGALDRLGPGLDLRRDRGVCARDGAPRAATRRDHPVARLRLHLGRRIVARDSGGAARRSQGHPGPLVAAWTVERAQPVTYVEAIVIGVLQGVTELFPVSSLGHSVLVPALIGGRWAHDLNVSAPESPYLAFIVGLHVATALALLLFFWRD